jgi:hypothetical protein
MIDHLLAFVDEGSAKADPVMKNYWYKTSDGSERWNDVCVVTGVLLWNPADDVEETDGRGAQVIRHVPYDNLWRLIIAENEENTDLSEHAACEMVANRDIPNVDRSHIIFTTFSETEVATLMMQPVFLGSAYPFMQPGNKGL